MDISVIICCYNSVHRLKPTLVHLAKQKLDGLICELILVDNNCTDNTVEVAKKVWSDNDSPFPLTILDERNPGLSNARKIGVLAAKGEIIVFCDDDNWLDENYLKMAFDLFKKDNRIFGACGFCQPVAEIPLPDWFEKYSSFYACGLPQIENDELLTLRGAGMVVQSQILKAIYMEGIRHFTTGRKGANLTSGEDDEISFWLKCIGGKVVYCEKLRLKHFMEEHRLTLAYRFELVNGIFKSINELRYFLNILKFALRDKRKLDLIMIFSSGSKGVSARLKLGFWFIVNKQLVKNYRILKKLKRTNWISQ